MDSSIIHSHLRSYALHSIFEMEPPPLPSISGRFRLRVQIYPQQEAYNLNAAPLRQFTIVKTPVLALLDLTLQELCDEVVKRFKVIYPGESHVTPVFLSHSTANRPSRIASLQLTSPKTLMALIYTLEIAFEMFSRITRYFEL